MGRLQFCTWYSIFEFPLKFPVSNCMRIRKRCANVTVSSDERSQTDAIENAPITQLHFCGFRLETLSIVESSFRLIDTETIPTLFVCRFSITPGFPPVLHQKSEGIRIVIKYVQRRVISNETNQKIYLDTEVDMVCRQNVIFNFKPVELYFARDKNCHLPPPSIPFPWPSILNVLYFGGFVCGENVPRECPAWSRSLGTCQTSYSAAYRGRCHGRR